MTTTTQARHLFGSYIHARRQELGLSLRQLEERTGIPNSRLSRWERGLELPDRPERLTPLATGLGLHLADLYAFAGIPLPTTLPGLDAYLRQRYGHLPEAAQDEIAQAADEIAQAHGTTLDNDSRPR